MNLLFYINGNLIDTYPLALHRLADDKERQAYLQGVINHLLEQWEMN